MWPIRSELLTQAGPGQEERNIGVFNDGCETHPDRQHLFWIFFFNLYFCVCTCAYMILASHVCRSLWRLEEKVGSPETEVMGVCELSSVGLGPEPRSSAKGVHASNPEPSLQPLPQLLKAQALPHV